MADPATRPPPPPGLVVVRDYVNSADFEEGWDLFAEPAGLAAWLRERELLEPTAAVAPADAERARSLREALRGLMRVNGGAEPDPGAAAVLGDVAWRARLAPVFTASGEAGLEPQAAGVDGALGLVVARVEAAMRDGTWPRMKSCAEHSCQWAFYDSSKNRSGRWCTMAVCGNRTKSRRAYRRRTRDARA